MTDKELADKVVALGVGKSEHGYYELELAPAKKNAGRITSYVKPDEFVRDPRVAMALMERVSESCVITVHINVGGRHFVDVDTVEESVTRADESLPRAIVEACVEALS